MKKHWFFDLDGTLAKTGEDIILCWKGSLEDLGRDTTHFEERFTIGPPLEKVVYDLYEDATPELVAALMERFKPRYDDGGFPNTVPYPGVNEFLARLKAAGAKLYIVTNKRDTPTQRIAKKFGWDKVFDGIWSYDSLEIKYKKPELLARLLKDLHIDPSDAVMVGDTKGDVDSGKANAMSTIAVTWGYGSREEILGADQVVNSFDPITF